MHNRVARSRVAGRAKLPDLGQWLGNRNYGRATERYEWVAQVQIRQVDHKRHNRFLGSLLNLGRREKLGPQTLIWKNPYLGIFCEIGNLIFCKLWNNPVRVCVSFGKTQSSHLRDELLVFLGFLSFKGFSSEKSRVHCVDLIDVVYCTYHLFMLVCKF